MYLPGYVHMYAEEGSEESWRRVDKMSGLLEF